MTETILYHSTELYNKNESFYEGNDEVNLDNWNVNKEQGEILKILSLYIEQGYKLSDVIEFTAEMLDIDVEDVMTEIENIKEKNQNLRGEVR